MKLYRGYKDRPIMWISKFEDELASLNKQVEGLNLIQIIKKLNAENLTRLIELRRLKGPQFFTDREEVAKDFAGDKGFIIVLDVPDKEARGHWQDWQDMAPSGKRHYAVDNYVFRGDELAQHSEWKTDLIEREREGEGKTHDESAFSKLRGIGGLPMGDKVALDQLRSKFRGESRDMGGKLSEGKPPVV